MLAENHGADAQRDDGVREIAPDIAYRQFANVSVEFYGRRVRTTDNGF